MGDEECSYWEVALSLSARIPHKRNVLRGELQHAPRVDKLEKIAHAP